MAIDTKRRRFIAWCSAAGLGPTLFPGALWAQAEGGAAEITPDLIDAAARLAGLEFSPRQREEMAAGIRANLAGFRDMRAIDIDQSIPPPLYFNPAVPGQSFEERKEAFVLGERPPVERPGRLEDLALWPVTAIARLVESRQVTASELTRMYLDRIRRFDPVLRSVITLTEERALEQAQRRDDELAQGIYRGPLHGIPWGAKDLLATKGYPTTWGFEAYRDQVIDTDATVVERLDEAGAVLLAKLSTGEIARGDQWLGVQTMNPWKTDEGAGGSSSGPAAATAAGLVGFSIGTDTLGSIVGPSRTCGISGLRPTFGRVSRHGVMPVCWSLDKVGPMCRSVEDCALVFDAVAGPDGIDLAVVDRPFNWDGNRALDDLRVGYLAAAFDRDPDPALENDRRALATLRDMGVNLEPVSLPAHADMDALQMLLVDEAAAFDELMHNGGIELFRQDIDEPEDMLMRIARLFPAVEYVQVNRRRMLLMQGMADLFAGLDVLVAPFDGSPQQSATSLTGHPSVTAQTGFDGEGRPTGIQFIGALYGEARAMTVARHFQETTGFHRQHPPAFV